MVEYGIAKISDWLSRYSSTRFLLVGVVQFILDLAVFCIIYFTLEQVVAANILGRLTGVAVGLYLHKKYTFKEGAANGNTHVQSAKFVFWWVATTLLTSSFLVWIERGQFDYHEVVLISSKMIFEVVVVGISFFVYKYWVYR